MARSHKVKGPRSEGIASAVERLGISVEDPGDIALLPPDAQKLDDAANTPNLGPLADDDDEGGVVTHISSQISPPRSSTRTALFEERQKPPVVQQPPPPPDPTIGTPIPYQEMTFQVPNAGEKAPKKEKPIVSPGVKRFGGLAKKLPGAERVRVHRRDPTSGALGYVGDYTQRDLQGHNDIEGFLNRYVKPHYGAGEYMITAIDGAGNEQQLAPVVLLEPPKQTQENSNNMLLRELVEDLKTKNQQPAPQAPNPVAMLKDLNEVSRSMQPPVPPPAPLPDFMGPLAAVIQASSQSTMAMMQMMQAQSA